MAMMEFLEQARRGDDYIRALEEERRKIEVFQRELPLCLQLITQAIESVRQHMSSSVDGRAVGLEENIPLRQIPTAAEEEPAVRPDWLRSVQLWNREAGTVERPKKPVAVKLKKTGGAFQPFEREKYVAAMSSTAAGDGGCRGGDDGEGGGDDGDGDGDGDCIIVDKDKERKEEGAGAGRQSQPNRKARRSWSPELHRRFLHALHQLGGSHVATPKEIKELMKVDGLTNDEIKSHLQKYRLHHRRPSPAVSQGSNVVHSCPPAPQFVLIGGILVQPAPEYTAPTVAAAAVAPSGNGRACDPPAVIYAPVMSPSLPQDLILQQQQQNTKRPQRSKKLRQRKEERKRNGDGDEDDNDDEDATNISTSPTTSASSHTTSISA